MTSQSFNWRCRCRCSADLLSALRSFLNVLPLWHRRPFRASVLPHRAPAASPASFPFSVLAPALGLFQIALPLQRWLHFRVFRPPCYATMRSAVLSYAILCHGMPCGAHPFGINVGSVGLILTFSALPNRMLCMATQWHSMLCHDALRPALLRRSMPWYARRCSPSRNQCILRHQPMRIDRGSTQW